MIQHPGAMLTCVAMILCAALPAEDIIRPGATADPGHAALPAPIKPGASRHGGAIAEGGGCSTVNAQALLQDLLRKHPELKAVPDAAGGNGELPSPGSSTHSRHCTATVNGKKVYDGPGSSVCVTSGKDGAGSREVVVVDGKQVRGH